MKKALSETKKSNDDNVGLLPQISEDGAREKEREKEKKVKKDGA